MIEYTYNVNGKSHIFNLSVSTDNVDDIKLVRQFLDILIEVRNPENKPDPYEVKSNFDEIPF